MTDTERLNKNQSIRESNAKTRLKRKSQICKTFKFKINKTHLTKSQSEALKMYFVETKRIYNYLIGKMNNNEIDIFNYDYRNLKTITYLDKDRNEIIYNIQHIGSSTMQDTVRLIKESITGLSVSKKNGNKVGSLRFKSECNSIRFKQYGITHKIKGSRFKIQGIKRPIRVCGLKQLDKYCNIDYTIANLLYDGYDYFVSLTCYMDPIITNNEKEDIIGIDLGCKTTMTLSNGEKISVSIEESDRLKGLQAKLANQQKRSNNWYKTKSKIRKEYNKITNKKNDISNKIIHNLTSKYKIIVMQDDQISEWKDDIKSRTVQHSILGRIKSKLKNQSNVIVLDQWFPTTKHCFNCGSSINIELSDRIFKCPVCGLKSDRDVHAAQNMIDFYLKYKSAGTVDSKPVIKAGSSAVFSY